MAAGKIDLSKIRNLGVIAHIDAGKTTTTEHLLYYAGAKHKLGGVDEGNTDTDYDPEEQERGITIYSACIPFNWRDCTDQPDRHARPRRFHRRGRAQPARPRRLRRRLRRPEGRRGAVGDGLAAGRQVQRAAAGVHQQDGRRRGQFRRQRSESIRQRLEGKPVPLIIPIGAGSIKDSDTPFIGIIDLIEMKALYFDPADQGKTIPPRADPRGPGRMLAQDWREKLFDALTQFDEKDQLTSAYLGGQGDSARRRSARVIREQTLARHDPAGAVRLGPRAHRHSAAARRGDAITCPARSIGRRWSGPIRRRRTRKRSASPIRRSRSAAWCSRSSPTRTASCSTSASTPAR